MLILGQSQANHRLVGKVTQPEGTGLEPEVEGKTRSTDDGTAKICRNWVHVTLEKVAGSKTQTRDHTKITS